MTAVLAPAAVARESRRSRGVWAAAAARFRGDRVGVVASIVVALCLLLVLAAAFGLVASDWQVERGVPDAPPTFLGPAPPAETVAVQQPTGPPVDISAIDPLAPRYKEWAEAAKKYRTIAAVKSETLPFGGDRLGRDVLAKAIKGAQVSILVGVSAALLATAIGTLLGALAGFFGGKVDDLLEWVYNVFTAIPGILLIFAFAAVFGRGIGSVVLILGLAGWTGIYRLLRAEFIKHAVRDYVRSAEAIGAGALARMFRHILPNVSHVVLVQLSINVVGFIKSEVILSYLGLGVAVDQVSWGTMLSEAQSELILGHWWQLAAATLFMAVFVTAFSLMTDALRDALDPKLRGSNSVSRHDANNFNALRLLFAYLVILSHAFELIDHGPRRELLHQVSCLTFGSFAVYGFFVISGLLITASYQRSRSWLDYLVKRILRIYPGYAVAFLLCLFVLAPWVGGVLEIGEPRFWYRRVLLRMLTLGTPMTENPILVGTYSPLLNGAMWTIRHEFVAYLSVLLVAAVGLLERRRLVLAAVVALGVTDAILEPMLAIGSVPRNPVDAVRFMFLFWSGAVLHLYRDRIVYSGRYAAPAAVAFVLLLQLPLFANAGFAVFGSYLIGFVALAVRSGRLAAIGSRNDLSYGVYLYGWPVEITIVWLAPAWHPIAVFVVSAAGASVLAYASWRLIEQPALRFKSSATAKAFGLAAVPRRRLP